MSGTTLHVPYVRPEEVLGTKLDRAIKFSEFCKGVILRNLSSGSEWDGRMLYDSVRSEVEIKFGPGSYVWELFESHLDDLIDADEIEVFDGEVWSQRSA